MVNINTALPTTIATPFHPPTEALHHDNMIQPIIPKTEIIASYTRLRKEEKQAQLTDQSRTIVQDQEQEGNATAQQQSMAEQRRLNFYATRANTEGDNESQELLIIKDAKLTISVIQARYNRAVTPIAEPTIELQL